MLLAVSYEGVGGSSSSCTHVIFPNASSLISLHSHFLRLLLDINREAQAYSPAILHVRKILNLWAQRLRVDSSLRDNSFFSPGYKKLT